ncbi:MULTISPECIES: hypothetical protein [unclassified Acinetobacter]|uniref:hypothetical protein n=1 Tax=unclassified Acinetobacter TaxID=196816 RepID=UPI0022ABFDB1|nr:MULTISPECIES: hypothetical protein [unclassified Acinetobacter]WAU72954.1 hypothetical protein O1450_12795 [Acinetobacter sp. TR11]WAU76049.1 hypothetical protein O1449_12310 [Acinetobacter sp. TR3]
MTAMQSLIDQFANTEEKIVQIGSFQPHTLVCVHHNPTDLVLSNEHDHTIASATVVLLNDGLERSGLKFKPNISNISQEHNSLKLILASTINQSISIEYSNYPAKLVNLEANKPVIMNIGSIFGIPMLESTTNFFDLAVDGNQPSNGWTLTNATLNDGVLTYTGGLIEQPNQTPVESIPSLFVSRTLNIGETVSIDINLALVGLTRLMLCADYGQRVGSWSDDSATIFHFQNNDSVILFSGRSLGAQTSITTLGTGYTASITKVSASVVNLSIIKEGQIVLTQDADFSSYGYEGQFSRIWLEIAFADTTTQFNAQLDVKAQGMQ